MMSLADGFLEALESDFDHVAPTAFTDGRSAELSPAKLQQVKDWSTLKSLSGDFPKIPPSEYGIPRPNSRQRVKTAEKTEYIVEKIRGMSPDGKEKGRSNARNAESRDGEEGLDPHHGTLEESNATTHHMEENEFSESGSDHRRIIRAPAANTQGTGWVYSQGWKNRPGIKKVNVGKISQDIALSAKRMSDKRDARPFQMGKHYAASFGKLPALERPRPPSYATDKSGADLARLRYILVDVSRARIPGPRYCLDPVENERAPAVNGRRKVQGSSLVTGFSKSILGKAKEYPSIDAFVSSVELGGTSVAFNGADESAMRASMESLNAGAMWAGRTESGSIYEAGGNQGGPGPAYNVNSGFLATSRPYTADRPQFSPINSAPGSPKTTEMEEYIPHGRRNPGRLSPELSKGFQKY